MFPPLRHIFLRLSGGGQTAMNFLTVRSGLLICALFLLVGLGLAGDYGIGPDEGIQRRIAQGNLNYILGRAEVSDPQLITTDRYYGVAFELPLLLAEGVLGLADYHYVHQLRLTLTHLFFIVGAFCCYRLAWRLFDNRLIALFALLLFLLHPRIYAHSLVNSKDLPFLSMFSIALYLLERAFRRDTIGAFILLGIAVGLLTNLRIAGVALLPAAVAMRGLDLWQADGWAGRKHTLLTAGLFTLAAGLTLYAVTPYAWTNPVDYLTASLALIVNHPNVVFELFQGRLIPSTELPPHYGLTWFGITTPPLVLLLGLVGMAAVVAQGIARPGAVFRNSRRRFQLLLLAGFALPLLAAALLGSNLYGNGRQLFFIYAPFCLLAAGGLHWLAAALARQSGLRAGAYGWGGLGLGLILLQMAQLHPQQQLYFNFLVDRATPNYLQSQYEMDSWRLLAREGLEYLLERHPGETLTVGTARAAVKILPAVDRRRLIIGSATREADYSITGPGQSQLPDLAFNGEDQRRFYNNDVLSVKPLQGEGMTAAAAAAYGEFYRQATAGDPIIRGDYNVYRNGRILTFVKEDCRPGDRAARFGVKVYPAPAALRAGYIPNQVAYDFRENDGVRLGDRCLALIELPDYPIDFILAGQYADGESRAVWWPRPLWSGLHSLARPGLEEIIAAGAESNSRSAEGGIPFALYPQAGRLSYYRNPCTPADTAARFFLHIVPEDAADLPRERRRYGFANRDFAFDRWGEHFEGKCLAVVPLPDYPIKEIRTGQYVPGQSPLWAVEAPGP